MKKILFAIAILAITSALLSSCRTHQLCPAYTSQANDAGGKNVKPL